MHTDCGVYIRPKMHAHSYAPFAIRCCSARVMPHWWHSYFKISAQYCTILHPHGHMLLTLKFWKLIFQCDLLKYCARIYSTKCIKFSGRMDARHSSGERESPRCAAGSAARQRSCGERGVRLGPKGAGWPVHSCGNTATTGWSWTNF
jgi:hypothetical protein